MLIEQPPLLLRLLYPRALWRMDKVVKAVYLTFDDGPCDTTRDLLALLKKYNAKATFFDCCQTANQEQYLDVIKDCVDQGHTVAVHTYSHKMQEKRIISGQDGKPVVDLDGCL